MKNILDFVNKWGFLIILCAFAVGLLFSIGCSIYTAIRGSLIVGIVGIVFNAICLALTIGWIFAEINEG